MSTFIKKETIQRLLHDVKNIIKHPLTSQGIYYVHDDSDMLKGYAMIIGPSETPYFGGFYFFEFTFPQDYPHSPPLVKYCTNGNNIRFNPNLYKCGKVCVSLLNTWRGDQWTSCQTISTVLLTLCTLLCKNPLLNEPGINSTDPDLKNYNEIIEFSNINISICDIISKKKEIYMPFFDLFYVYAKQSFLENYEKLLSFVETKSQDTSIENQVLSTEYYELNVHINYAWLIDKLKNTKLIFETP